MEEVAVKASSGTVKIAYHPELLENWENYKSIDDFTNGLPSRVVFHLIPHRSEVDGTKEGTAQLEHRQRRLYHVNGCKRYLRTHVSHMAQPIEISGTDSEQLTLIKEDATGFGKDYLHSARDWMWHFTKHGLVGVLVDGPPKVATNKGEAKQQGERSYQVLYPATKIIYWEHFTTGIRRGKLREVCLREDSETDEKGKRYDVVRRFFMDDSVSTFQWQRLRSRKSVGDEPILNAKPREYDVIENGVGDLDRIPFVMTGCGPEDSFVQDVWPLDKAMLNLGSVASNILDATGFRHVVMVGVRPEEVTKMNEYSITLAQNEKAKVIPIEPGNPEGLFKEMENLRRERHRIGMFRQSEVAEDSKATQSADAKQKDMTQQRAMYEQAIDLQTKALRDIWRLHAEMEGEDPKKIEVTIAREYGLEDPVAEQAKIDSVFSKAQALGEIETQREVLKKEVSEVKWVAMNNETEDELRKRLFAAIDKAGGQTQEPSVTRTLIAAQNRAAVRFGNVQKAADPQTADKPLADKQGAAAA